MLPTVEWRQLGVQGGMKFVMLPVSGNLLSLLVSQSAQGNEQHTRVIGVFSAPLSPIPKLSPERASEKTKRFNDLGDQVLENRPK